jgi:type VI secretion system protein ImpJ
MNTIEKVASPFAPIYWHQGLFLQPQHFQYFDLYVQSLSRPFNKLISPYFWGAVKVRIVESSLKQMVFDVSEGELIFPDRAYVAFPNDNAKLAPRSFEQAWNKKSETFSVYLGIKKLNVSEENVAIRPDLSLSQSLLDVAKRFITDNKEYNAADIHGAQPHGKIKQLHYFIKILWETEKDNASDYSLIPIAKLVKDGQAIKLSNRFIPSCVTIQSDSVLFGIVKEIRDQIAGRSRELEAYKRQRGVQSAEFGAKDTAYLLALRSLNRYAPLLSHYLEIKDVHPCVVYGTLRQIIGEFSSFSEDINANGELKDKEYATILALPPYDHQRLWECFATAQDLIERLLNVITAGPEQVVTLVYDSATQYFTAELKDDVFVAYNRFYLIVKSDDNPAVLTAALESVTTKLSSLNYIKKVIAQAIPGVTLEKLRLNDLPNSLPRWDDCVYFAVDHNHTQWDDIKEKKTIALYCPAYQKPESMKAQLMIVSQRRS